MAGNAAGGGNDPNRQGRTTNKNKGGNKGGGNKGGGKRKQGHPGGAGAVFGVRVLRYSGVQGVSLLIDERAAASSRSSSSPTSSAPPSWVRTASSSSSRD